MTKTARMTIGLLVVGIAALFVMAISLDTSWSFAGVLQSRKTSLGSLSGQEGLCQYAVEDEEEALAKGLDPSVAGTTINITDLYYGRLGNHFTTASRFLSLGYCCRAKLVTLPPKDPILAPGMFSKGVPGPRHFDFSDAPSVPGFNSSAECAPEYKAEGEGAYRAFLPQNGRPYGNWRQEALATCVRSVRLLDCEAAYYFPKFRNICPSSAHPLSLPAYTSLSEPSEPAERSSDRRAARGGNLVIHVRSGDVFKYKHAFGTYGQPPLSFYKAVIGSHEWSQVDVVSHGEENPVMPALKKLLPDRGIWSSKTKFNFHVDRPIEVDLKAMLCADALATARSTLGELTSYHTRAKVVFLPSTCQGNGSAFGHTPESILAARSSRDATLEVHGVRLKPDAPAYTPYETTVYTRNESLEMLEYAGLAGMERCSSSTKSRARWDRVPAFESVEGNAVV